MLEKIIIRYWISSLWGIDSLTCFLLRCQSRSVATFGCVQRRERRKYWSRSTSSLPPMLVSVSNKHVAQMTPNLTHLTMNLSRCVTLPCSPWLRWGYLTGSVLLSSQLFSSHPDLLPFSPLVIVNMNFGRSMSFDIVYVPLFWFLSFLSSLIRVGMGVCGNTWIYMYPRYSLRWFSSLQIIFIFLRATSNAVHRGLHTVFVKNNIELY